MDARFWKSGWLSSFGFAAVVCCSMAVAQTGATFQNPVKDVGPDPWVYTWKGYYYFMNSAGQHLAIWKTKDMTDLRNVVKKVV